MSSFWKISRHLLYEEWMGGRVLQIVRMVCEEKRKPMIYFGKDGQLSVMEKRQEMG